MSIAAIAGSLPAMLVPTLVAWIEQVCILTAAAALAALALTNSKARLRMWQGLLVMLLLLPAIEPWNTPPMEVDSVAVGAGVTLDASVAAVPRAHWRPEYWIWAITAGAVLRLMWVAAGFLRLRRYRRQAQPINEPPLPFTSDAASWYASDSVPGPVTYGWLRPVILLPSKVLALPADLREAIECHELIHVRRGDWLFVLAESLVRSLLWFHPAIWFVLSRIQLAREQAVDREAVDLLQNRESYLNALVAVAGHKLYPDLAPAPLFLRKRHLAARVAAIVREVNMSRSRIAAGVAAVCSAALIAACAAMWMFPFVSQAQTAPDSPGITVNAGATLLHRTPVSAPPRLSVSGTVIVDATLDAKGEVSDARVLSGPEELRKESLASVLQWHYQPGPTRAQITIQFAGATAAAAKSVESVGGGGRSGAPPPRPPQSLAPLNGTIKSIQFLGTSAEAEEELRQKLEVREGDVVDQTELLRIGDVVSAFDSHLVLTHTTGGGEGTPEYHLQVRAPGAMVVGGAAVAVPADAPVPSGAQRVSPAIQAQKLLSHPTPIYPPLAKSARVQGAVTFQAIIGVDGTMQNLQVLSADSPLLVQSAMDAVKQWTYSPTLLNGDPVMVVTTIDVNFTLAN